MKLLISLIALFMGMQIQASTTEALLGYTYNQYGVTFQVASSGCTSKNDFSVARGNSDQTLTLILKRVKADGCLAVVPYGLQVHFTYKELGVRPNQSFKILNQLTVSRRSIEL